MTRLDAAFARRMAAAAHSAPTPDNSQPFSYRWDGEALHLSIDRERARHRLDAGGCLGELTLGCLTECVALAASTEGVGVDLERRDGPPVLRFRPGAVPDPLASALSLRCTDRRPFGRAPVPPDLAAALRGDVGRFGDLGLHLARPDRRLIRHFERCDSRMWEDPATTRDTLRWVRFSDAELRRRGDGLSYRHMGIDPIAGQGMRAARGAPNALPMLGRLGGRIWTGAALRRRLKHASILGCVAAPSDRERLFDVGRATLRCWVRLNAAGWGFQPWSLASTELFVHALGLSPADLPPSIARIYEEGLPFLREVFGLGDALPGWIFRAGPVSPLPAGLRSPRRPLDAVFSA